MHPPSHPLPCRQDNFPEGHSLRSASARTSHYFITTVAIEVKSLNFDESRLSLARARATLSYCRLVKKLYDGLRWMRDERKSVLSHLYLSGATALLAACDWRFRWN